MTQLSVALLVAGIATQVFSSRSLASVVQEGGSERSRSIVRFDAELVAAGFEKLGRPLTVDEKAELEQGMPAIIARLASDSPRGTRRQANFRLIGDGAILFASEAKSSSSFSLVRVRLFASS